jgi:hypothetical protein
MWPVFDWIWLSLNVVIIKVSTDLFLVSFVTICDHIPFYTSLVRYTDILVHRSEQEALLWSKCSHKSSNCQPFEALLLNNVVRKKLSLESRIIKQSIWRVTRYGYIFHYHADKLVIISEVSFNFAKK